MNERRILYLVPGAMASRPDGAAELARRRDYLRHHAMPGSVVEIRDNPQGPAQVESAAEERAAAESMARMFPGVEVGYDAVIVGCFGDPGVESLRRTAPVPVVGPALASSLLALQLVPRIAFLTVVDAVVPVLERRLRQYGLAAAVVAIQAVNVPVLELRARREEVIERLRVAGRSALADGAGALVLGCMTMGFLDVAAELQQELAVPVVNPTLAALHSAEALCVSGLRSRAGLAAAARGSGPAT